MKITFGQYKGRLISSMTSVVETNYLRWLLQSKFGSFELKQEIKKQLN